MRILKRNSTKFKKFKEIQRKILRVQTSRWNVIENPRIFVYLNREAANS